MVNVSLPAYVMFITLNNMFLHMFFFSGIVTTLSLLSSTILCLLNHPEYQDEVYKLLSEVIGDKRNASLNDKQSCPLIEAIEMEVHRLITVVPLLQRDLNDDIQFDGFHLPNNAMVLNLYYRLSNKITFFLMLRMSHYG